MISAIVTSATSERSIAATLSSLTPAAVDGFVRELVVASAGGDKAALEIADDAGARIAAGGLGAAVALARHPWLLIVPAGVRLQIGWEGAARTHIRRYPDAAGWFQLNYAADGLAARLGEAWSNGQARWLGRPRAQHGLLIPARQWSETAGRAKGFRPIRARILVGGLDLED